jgi:two-component system, LuxR family, sensor kinase FixL
LPHNSSNLAVSLNFVLHKSLLSLGFIGLYIALDAASFIHPLHGLNITPWNPAPALGLVFLLRQGAGSRPLLIAAVLLSECLVRGLPFPWWKSLLSALILAAGYLLLSEVLRRRMPPTTLLNDRATLLGWMVPVVLGTLLNSLVYLTSLHLLGLLPSDGLLIGVLQFWVGDAVGITVAMPLFWWLTGTCGRLALRSAFLCWETLGYSLLGLLALWIAFGLGGDGGFKLFYFLFLPIVWAAARQGMAGAIVSATLLQIGVIAAVQVLDFSAVTVAELQMLAVVMALVGFFIGGVVDEQRRTSGELRQTLRLAAAGEMAGALAHELNQPLTAMGAYASAYDALQARGEAGARLDAAINGMRAEAQRAGDVVRRLRDFFRTGATKLETVVLGEIIVAAAARYKARALQSGVTFLVMEVPEIMLLADRLQLEVVLRNRLSNAFDAVVVADVGGGQVSIQAVRLPGEQVMICVEDSGAGLTSQDAERAFESFHSSKSSGLGLGLVISRAIAETHGGSLWGDVADHGVFKLVLPTLESSKTPLHDR